MRVISDIKKMQARSRTILRKGKTIGFVPTMGYLHEGHLSLIHQAKKDIDICVMSIFVNPIQFGPKEDFKRYPRDLKRDIQLAKRTGVDIIFCPDVNDMYPEYYFTYVEVEKLTEGLCGASRQGHFRGVTTVVAKLFNIVIPSIAYFGQKDAQQAIVIKKMAMDLNFPIKIKIMPTIREDDGLAMSSRNSYLDLDERLDGLVLYKSLQKAKELIESGVRNPTMIKQKMSAIIRKAKSAKIDYIEIVNLDKLEPIKRISGRVLIAVAVWINKKRLIDNIIARVSN